MMILAAALAAQLLAAACTDKPATVTNAVPPDVSESYLKAHKPNGSVVLKVTVSPSGTPTEITVASSTINDQNIVEGVIRAARDSKYSPATHDCKPATGAYLFKADFKPYTP